MTEHPDRLERTLELLLYAPIGVGLFLKDTAPTFVNMFVSRGRAEVDRRQDEVQQRVTTARSLGQVALAFGPPVVRKHVEKTVADALHRVEGVFGTPASEPAPGARRAAETSPADVPASAPVPEPGPWTPPSTAVSASAATEEPQSNGSGDGGLPGSAGLPIPGYDALSASQVVARLTGLAPEELDAVRAYEASHRKRRTIIGKIEQLAG